MVRLLPKVAGLIAGQAFLDLLPLQFLVVLGLNMFVQAGLVLGVFQRLASHQLRLSRLVRLPILLGRGRLNTWYRSLLVLRELEQQVLQVQVSGKMQGHCQ